MNLISTTVPLWISKSMFLDSDERIRNNVTVERGPNKTLDETYVCIEPVSWGEGGGLGSGRVGWGVGWGVVEGRTVGYQPTHAVQLKLWAGEQPYFCERWYILHVTCHHSPRI